MRPDPCHLALPLLCLLVIPAMAAEPEPTAEDILDRTLEALGGETRLSANETLELDAQIEVQGLTGTFKSWSRAPGSSRIEVDLAVIRITRAFDGEEAWEERGENVAVLVGDDLDRIERGSRLHPVLDYKRNGTPMRLLGREPVGERETWVLELTPEQGGQVRLFVDAETWLPLKEVSLSRKGDEGGARTTIYGDYRPHAGLMLPMELIRDRGGQVQKTTISEYRVDVPQAEDLYARPGKVETDEPLEIALSTIPRAVYKENDGVWSELATESWVFHVLVDEKYGRRAEPASAVVELFRGETMVKRLELSAEALNAVAGTNFTGMAAQKEVYDLRHQLSEPADLEIDRMVYSLELTAPDGSRLEESLEIPLARYELSNELIFPVRGKFIVAGGHASNDDHKSEWSQHYADDILVLGEGYEMLVGEGVRNEDFATWGAEILAPAAGTVVYALNEVPDNDRPGVIDLGAIQTLPDPFYAVGGNLVIVDHGHDEFSMLAHMIQGSVRVEVGDEVEQGQVLGLLGNSGNSDAPHLHYHLMSGPVPFRSDGLPSRFGNVYLELFAEEGDAIPMPAPKRGIPLVAR